MMLALALAIVHTPWGAGTYGFSAGTVGAGGMSESITLAKDGTYAFQSHGCFVNESRTGTFRQFGDRIETTETVPSDAKRSGRRDRYRLVLREGTIYLVEEEHWRSGHGLERRAVPQVETVAPMSLRKNAPWNRTASADA